MFKKISTLFILLAFTAYMPLTAMADYSVLNPGEVNPGLPTLDGVINGSVGINEDKTGVGATVGTGITGEVAQFDWQTFNLDPGKFVYWYFTNHSQTAINRVLGPGASQINGTLRNYGCANCGYENSSKVIFINPSGVMFGGGANVDLNSFTVSTYDLQGAQNAKGATSAYINGLSTNYGMNGGQYKSLTFDGSIVGNPSPATGASIDIGEGAIIYGNKSLTFAADKISVYKPSLLATNTTSFNYGKDTNTGLNTKSYSNIKLVTGNGFEFMYINNGFNDNTEATLDVSGNPISGTGLIVGKNAADPAKDYIIDIDSTIMESGDIYIRSAGTSAGSKIDIRNSDLKGVKLENVAYGNVIIKGDNTVNINNVLMSAVNNDKYNTDDIIKSGYIKIEGKNGVIVDNARLFTAYSNKLDGSGDITIASSNGAVRINEANLESRGNITVNANQDVDIIKSTLTARSNGAFEGNTLPIAGKNLTVTGKNVNIDTATLDSGNNTTIKATGTNGSNGTITVDGKNNLAEWRSILHADNTLSILAAATTIEETLLGYSSLLFDDGTFTNNVTLKGLITIDNGSTDLTLANRGSLIVDGAEFKIGGHTRTFDTDTKSIYDHIVGDIFDNITLTSSVGSVEVKNSSNVTAKNNVTANAANDIKVDNSNVTGQLGAITLAAGGDVELTNVAKIQGETGVTITATNTTVDFSKVEAVDGNASITSSNSTNIQNNGAVWAKGNVNLAAKAHTIKGNSTVISTGTPLGNINITQQDAFIANGNSTGSLQDTSFIQGNNVNITTTGTGSDIIMNETGLGYIAYGGTLSLDAKKDVLLTSSTDLSLKDVIIKGIHNILEAENGNITLNNVVLDSSNTVTELIATGNIETDAKTIDNDLLNAGNPIFWDFEVTTGGTLDLNGSKLVVNAGNDVNLVFGNTGAGSTANGVEVTGKNVVLNTKDNGLSALYISRIDADYLNLNPEAYANGNLLSSATTFNNGERDGLDVYAPVNEAPYNQTGDPTGRGYIKVNNFGGFNLDPDPTPVGPNAPSGMYQGSYQYKAGMFGGDSHYGKHLIDLQSGNGDSQFLLVYDRVDACIDEPITPPPAPTEPDVIEPIILEPDAASTFIRLPLQAEILGTPGPILNNLTDLSGQLVAAAAGITLEDDDDDLY